MAPNKRKILEAARKHAQKGNQSRALKEYERLLKLDPRDAKLRLEIGDTQRRWGQVDEAIAAYSKVAEQYMQEGFDARAVAVYKQIQNLDADRYESYVPLADLYQRMGLVSEAIQALQTAADGYHKQGKKREALELLRKMATLDPSNTTSRIKIADLLRQEDMIVEAIAEYEAALEEIERQGETEAAGKVLERILEIDSNRIPTLVALSKNLLGRGQAERAEPFVKRAMELESDEAGHYELMADVYLAQQRDEEMADTYRKLADLYRQRGDEDKAREIIQRFAQPEFAAPLEPDIGEEMLLGNGEAEESTLLDDEFLDDGSPVLDDTVDLTDAMGSEDPLLELDEEMPELSGDLPAAPVEEPVVEDLEPPEGDPEQLLAEASVYLRYGKRAQAVRNLEAILEQEPDHRGALEKLGDAHAEGGDNTGAVDAWRRAAERARVDGDQETVAVLRDRIGALDPEAAAAIAGAPDPDEDLIDVGDLDTSAADETTHDDSGDLDLDDEIEIDDASLDADDEAPAEASAALDLDDGPVTGDSTPLQEAPADASRSQGESASISMNAQIQEDLEEAEFYRQQGLYDEAEAIYQRVLQAAPNHPTALVRMGEIEAARGGSPSSTASEVPVPDGPDLPPTKELPAVDSDAGEDLADWTDGDVSDADLGLEGEPEQPVVATEAEEVEVEVADLDLDGDVELEAEPEVELPEVDSPEVDLDDDLSGDISIEESEPEAAIDESGPVSIDVPEEMVADQLAADSAGESFDDLLLEADADETGDADPAGESFDLAAELAGALDDGDSVSMSGSTGSFTSMSEQDIFSAVFSEFKKGVDKALGEGDHEAHYDLGIAYREMGLLDDAIGEFQSASKSPARHVDGLHMMSLCALDLGRSEEAAAHLQVALDTPDISDDQILAVRFELGRAFEALEDLGRAREAWQAVAAVDPSFCEVEERLATLGEAKPEPEDAGFESFDDLFEDDDEDGDSGPVVADPGESFDDLIAEVNTDDEPSAGADDATDEIAVGAPEPEPAPKPEPVAEEKKPRRRKKKISFV